MKCSLDSSKRGFYRAANSIFGKVGRIASKDEEVIYWYFNLYLPNDRLPILLYGL